MKTQATKEGLVGSNPPIGTIIAYGGHLDDKGKLLEVPKDSGWYLCNGAPADRGKFEDLLKAIDQYWGNGNGSTTFNLPDLRAMFLRGVNGNRKKDGEQDLRDPDVVKKSRPNEVGTLQQHAFANHHHGIDFRKEGQLAPGDAMATTAGNGTNNGHWPTTGAASGSGEETRPNNAAVHWIIRAK